MLTELLLVDVDVDVVVVVVCPRWWMWLCRPLRFGARALPGPRTKGTPETRDRRADDRQNKKTPRQKIDKEPVSQAIK